MASEAQPGSITGASGDTDQLYLIDGSGYIFRAFHALPMLTRPDGTPINAVMGFTNMLMRLLADHPAGYLAVVFDAARENFRTEIYPEYKANREAPPPELEPQFDLIQQAVDAFDIPALNLEGYEADDIIATYARLARAQNIPVTVVSSDKDLLQLIGEGVRLFDPIKNQPLGADAAQKKFLVPPEQVPDVQALAGDSIDNIPGVPGIGIKTAAQLIADYGDLESLLGQAAGIKQAKRRQNLLAYADQARTSKRLVQLDERVPVAASVAELAKRRPEPGELLRFVRAQGFRQIEQRLRDQFAAEGVDVDAALGDPEGSNAQADPGGIHSAQRAYHLVQDRAALARWVEAIQAVGRVAVDCETTSLTATQAELVGLSLAVRPGEAAYVPVAHTAAESQLDRDTVLAELGPILADPAILKIGQNIKYDQVVLGRYGVRVAPVDDTLLLSYTVDGGQHGHGMDALARHHLGVTPAAYKDVVGTGKQAKRFDAVPLAAARDYAAEDADLTWRLHRLLKPQLVEKGVASVYESLDRPLVPIIAGMEQAGIKVDTQRLGELSEDFAQRLARLEERIFALAGREFNVGSPKQLGPVLFEELGLPASRTGKSGQYSTSSEILEPLANQGYEICRRVLDHRQIQKLKSTYTDALPEQVNPATGRIHTSFTLAATNTGRLSSTDPNLQNIPIRTEEGRTIRTAFVAEPGHQLLSIDYSQIELRLVADIAGVPALQEAFRNGQDIHAKTAAEVFGLDLESMDPENRRKAKTINFGIIYGISAYGLAQSLGVSRDEAGAYIRAYLDRYPEIRSYMEAAKAMARDTGYVQTLFNRRVHISGLNDRQPASRSFAERQAINAPVQGSAADIVKRAMVRVPRALARAGLSARLLLQVHDELIFEVPDAEVEATAETARAVMESACELSVPLTAEASWGPSWAAAH